MNYFLPLFSVNLPRSTLFCVTLIFCEPEKIRLELSSENRKPDYEF